jgi:hypothetical protein
MWLRAKGEGFDRPFCERGREQKEKGFDRPFCERGCGQKEKGSTARSSSEAVGKRRRVRPPVLRTWLWAKGEGFGRPFCERGCGQKEEGKDYSPVQENWLGMPETGNLDQQINHWLSAFGTFYFKNSTHPRMFRDC